MRNQRDQARSTVKYWQPVLQHFRFPIELQAGTRRGAVARLVSWNFVWRQNASQVDPDLMCRPERHLHAGCCASRNASRWRRCWTVRVREAHDVTGTAGCSFLLDGIIRRRGDGNEKDQTAENEDEVKKSR